MGRRRIEASRLGLVLRQARRDRLFRVAVDNAPEIIFIVASDARLLDVNAAACERLEYSRAELLSMRIFDIDPDYQPEIWPTHWREICERRSLVIETRQRTRSGRVFPAEVSIRYFEHRGAGLCTSVTRDISERVTQREALRRKQAEVLELSAPVLKVAAGVLAVPIIGEVDAPIAARVTDTLLAAVVRERAALAVLDLTGVRELDAVAAERLVTIARALRLLGCSCCVSGLSPAAAAGLAGLDVDLGALRAFGTLQAALDAALRR